LLGTNNYAILFTIIFAAAMLVTVDLMIIASAVASLINKAGVVENFARFGYAFIPLDLAAHISHNLFHLLAEGKSVVYTAAALFGYHISGSTAIVSDSIITFLQYLLLGWEPLVWPWRL